MNNQSYTKDQLIDIILEVAYADPQERQRIDRDIIEEHFSEFELYIEHCWNSIDFLDCMMDLEYEFLDLILEIVEDKM